MAAQVQSTDVFLCYQRLRVSCALCNNFQAARPRQTTERRLAPLYVDLEYDRIMVYCCVVPGCSNRSDRDRNISFHCLPLKNKSLLKVWIHKIWRKNLPLKNNSRVCSDHFVNSVGRYLRSDEYPTLNLPKLTTPVQRRRSPVKLFLSRVDCKTDSSSGDNDEEASSDTMCGATDSSCQTDMDKAGLQNMEDQVEQMHQRIAELEKELFRLENISHDPKKVLFYTGFVNYAALRACYDYLGPAVERLHYWGSNTSSCKKKTYRSLPPLEEFFGFSQTSTGPS